MKECNEVFQCDQTCQYKVIIRFGDCVSMDDRPRMISLHSVAVNALNHEKI
jgi:hypothetical protein